MSIKLHPVAPGPRRRSSVLAPLVRGISVLLVWTVCVGEAQAQDSHEAQARATELFGKAKFSQGIKLLNKDAKRIARAGETATFEHFMLLSRGYNGQGYYSLSEQAARKALELAVTARQQLTAHNGVAVSLFAEGTADDIQMQEAAEHFEAALDVSQGRSNVVRLGLAKTFIYLYREAEAIELLESVLADAPNTEYAKQARRLIDDPMRATHVAADQLSFDLVDGSGRVTLKDLQGKVVLVDFWATWCLPCRLAIPKLGELAEKYRDEPFELLSLSVDEDTIELKRFIATNSMTWMQGWDDGARNARVYQVAGYPAYILIGPDGEVLWRGQGWNEEVEMGIKFEVDRALAALARR